MKKPDKKALTMIALRILAGVVAIAAIVGLALYSDSQNGNIVSLLIAEFKMKGYMYDKYSTLHLDYLNTYYDQYSHLYMGEVKSPEDPDIKFSIKCYQLRIVYDNYSQEVASGKTKMERLEKEYGSSVAAELINDYPRYISSVFTSVSTPYEGEEKNSVSIEITVKNMGDFSPKVISDLLTQIDKTLTDNNHSYKTYGLTLDVQAAKIPGVYGIKPELVRSGQLESILNQALTEPDRISEEYGIQYYPK